MQVTEQPEPKNENFKTNPRSPAIFQKQSKRTPTKTIKMHLWNTSNIQGFRNKA